MRESARGYISKVPYEAPLLRVVALDCGRIVVDSFVGDTHLGAFGDVNAGWNSLTGSSGNACFGDGGTADWNGGSTGAFDDSKGPVDWD